MPTQALDRVIAQELGLRPGQVAAAIALFDDGNTIPFVARYRKEATGTLDEEQLRNIAERLDYLRRLDERRTTILASIDEQGKLTSELAQAINETTTLQALDDLYVPYRPKRRTRATIARERGLEPLAETMLKQRVTLGTPESNAARYVNDDVPTPQDALQGAMDIIAEMASEDAALRQAAREQCKRTGEFATAKRRNADDPEGTYADYYEFSGRLAGMPPHRILAINRGEAAKVLRVTLAMDADRLIQGMQRTHAAPKGSMFAELVEQAVVDGYDRLVWPAIERQMRAELTENAEKHAIGVFGANLGNLLMQPPLKGQAIMGIDPGYRTGCKVACIDATGRYLMHTTIYPHPPQRRWDETKHQLTQIIQEHDIKVVAIGNGTASRESEALVAEMIAEGEDVAYVMVSEAGASVYSASKLARRELPDLDVSIRGAVSIARRLQDPLAELCKIEPKSIGVGLYQHDVDQKALGSALDTVVESVVNRVGVNVNTASPALLAHVSGLSTRTAESIVAQRDAQGPFHIRRQLLGVKGLGAKTFEQCAGFLRIPEGDSPLDNTFIHPESYDVCSKLLDTLAVSPNADNLESAVDRAWQERQGSGESTASLAKALGCGEPTLADMIENLVKPGLDPRDELPTPILRRDVLKMEDLTEGMILQGTVRNVVDFGAFVDIGVKQDGLVHISQMADHYVRNPQDVVAVGDVITVRVLSVDKQRNRIALTMKS